jgi:hypothetical protein
MREGRGLYVSVRDEARDVGLFSFLFVCVSFPESPRVERTRRGIGSLDSPGDAQHAPKEKPGKQPGFEEHQTKCASLLSPDPLLRSLPIEEIPDRTL